MEYIHSCSSIVFIVGMTLWLLIIHDSWLLVIIGCMPSMICIRQHGSAVYIYRDGGLCKRYIRMFWYIHTLHYSNAVNTYVHMHERLVCSNFHTIYNLYSYTVYNLYNKHVHMYEWLVLYYSNSIGILHVVWSHTHACLNAQALVTDRQCMDSHSCSSPSFTMRPYLVCTVYRHVHDVRTWCYVYAWNRKRGISQGKVPWACPGKFWVPHHKHLWPQNACIARHMGWWDGMHIWSCMPRMAAYKEFLRESTLGLPGQVPSAWPRQTNFCLCMLHTSFEYHSAIQQTLMHVY